MIKLTTDDGQSLYLNGAYIVYMEKFNQYTAVNIYGSYIRYVEETPEEIMMLIRQQEEK